MMQYTLGQKVGLQGTPMIIAANGVALPGYMPPQDLLTALDRIAEEAKAGGGQAPGSR
jgi:thiol:disulfide interchange protein DsbC